MKKPLIGLTAWRSDSGKGYKFMSVTEEYSKAILEAGAIPMLIPLGLSEEDLSELRSRLDGLLLTGGGDIHPSTYQTAMHETVRGVDPDRDSQEYNLAKGAIENRMPFLGICRGLQMINIVQGGTLYTHVKTQHPGAIDHDFTGKYPRDKISHPIRIEEGSRLAEIIEEPLIQVNSLHHQGVRELGKDLTPVAYAPDGLIEGFEMESHPFGLAVQWHPEWVFGEHRTPALFEAFVHAAANGQSG